MTGEDEAAAGRGTTRSEIEIVLLERDARSTNAYHCRSLVKQS
jgi:hypothetical protein